jgi:glutamate/tyrosine decarboxylase-like PLP-dependent enzyme
LEKISRQLEIPASERAALLKKAGDYTSQFIAGLVQIKAFEEVNRPSKLLAIDKNIKTIDQVLELYQNEVATKGIIAASGGHLGYIPGGGIYAAAIADFIAAATNPYAGVYYASPGAATIENEVLSWLKNIFDFPETAVGNLTSGGSIATLIALTAARDKHQIKNENITKSVVYLSEQVHHATQKTLRLIGLEDVIVRYVPLDENHKIKALVLDEFIANDKGKGFNPFLVVATAGTTDTGAIDPLDSIAEITARQKLWFHVDAAYGGFFILSSKKPSFNGIEKADSLVVDPHKGMFLPYGLGAVLIKDKKAVFHSYRYNANYMQDAVDEDLADSPANVSPELTKHFRGLRLWLPLQIHGIEPFVACLEEKLLLTAYFREKLVEMGFMVGPEPDLSVSYFWYPFDGDANAKNKKLMEAIHRDGSVFLSSSIINKQFVIRMAILSFRTKRATIDKALEMIARCLKEVK